MRQWREWRDRNFPERQIIFRSRGDVRYIALSGRSQLLLGSCLLAFAGWLGYASVNAIYRDTLIESRDRRIAELTIAYERLAQDFERNQENFLVASRDLEERYRKLHEMASKQGLTHGDQAAAGNDAKPAAKTAAPVALAAKPPEVKPAEIKPVEIKPAEIKPAEVKPAEKLAEKPAPEKPTLAADKTALALATAALPSAAPVVASPAQPAATSNADGNPRSIEDLEAMLRASRQKQIGAVPKAGEIEARILGLRGRQRDVVEDLSQRTEKSVAALETSLRGTGLDVESLLKRHAAARAEVGIGGPLRTVADAAGNIPPAIGVAVDGQIKDPIDRDVAKLEGKLGRWGELVALAQRLPLALPVDPEETETSSGFGRRMDPFTKQWAFHAGLDLIGPRHAPVQSTAPGVVVFAGRKGPYGRAVEIDHGLGIKTRYAHLNSIAVQVGDTIAFNKRIGTMGSTGRSTGQHLHYEILLDDEPVDPSKFIEAGYHVFKQQEDTNPGR